MQKEHLAFEKCPLEWIEARDIQDLSFEKATWIPLVMEKLDIIRGQFGKVGYRKAYRDFDSVIPSRPPRRI